MPPVILISSPREGDRSLAGSQVGSGKHTEGGLGQSGSGMTVNVEKIIQEMEHTNWTIAELADHAGIPRQTLYLILKTEAAQLKTLTKIAEALDLDGKDLLI